MVEEPVPSATPAPQKHRRRFPWIFVSLLATGWFFDTVVYSMLNMLSFIGGPLAWAVTLLRTLVFCLVVEWIYRKAKLWCLALVAVALPYWLPMTLALYSWADPIQVQLYRQDTERVARRYGGGDLPPGCTVGLPWRARAGTDIVCSSTFESVVDFYRKRLGPDWTERRDSYGVTFENRKHSDQWVLVQDVKEARVIVSPTWH